MPQRSVRAVASPVLICAARSRGSTPMRCVSLARSSVVTRWAERHVLSAKAGGSRAQGHHRRTPRALRGRCRYGDHDRGAPATGHQSWRRADTGLPGCRLSHGSCTRMGRGGAYHGLQSGNAIVSPSRTVVCGATGAILTIGHPFAADEEVDGGQPSRTITCRGRSSPARVGVPRRQLSVHVESADFRRSPARCRRTRLVEG